ncbi:MAG: YbjQ family protein [Candidatus Sumerlaeia bacterium]|nr:YbjQ family protein [Candidatus Sumerlaeia bacterium]
MILATTEEVPGHTVVKICGLAKGCSVRGLHLGDDIVARAKNAVGGEVHEYTQVFAQCREQALDRMVNDAKALGANAVIGLRFQSAEIGANMAEMMAYGTAVIIEPQIA